MSVYGLYVKVSYDGKGTSAKSHDESMVDATKIIMSKDNFQFVKS